MNTPNTPENSIDSLYQSIRKAQSASTVRELDNAMNQFVNDLKLCGDALPIHDGGNKNTLSLMQCDHLLQEFQQAVEAYHDMARNRPILETFHRQLLENKFIRTDGSEWRAVQRAFDPKRLGSCEGLRTAHAQDYQLWEWVQQKNWLNRLLSLWQKQKVQTLTPSEMEELDQVQSPERYPFVPDELFDDIRRGVLKIFNDLFGKNR